MRNGTSEAVKAPHDHDIEAALMSIGHEAVVDLTARSVVRFEALPRGIQPGINAKVGKEVWEDAIAAMIAGDRPSFDASAFAPGRYI